MIKTFKGLGVEINYEYYNSTSEMVRDCRSRTITNSNFENAQTMSYDDDFEHVGSYDEALELLDTGYQPTVDNLKGKISKINLGDQGKRMSFNQNVVGFAPIVPLALQGVPNSMISTTIKPIKAKVVDVYYDMTAPCYVSAKQFLKAGEDILSAIMELEMQGYRFNLFAVQSYSCDRKADMVVVKVKDARQPLDLKRVSFPLTHPAFFRAIGFDWYSKFPIGTHRWGYGHELSRDVSNMQEVVKKMFGGNAVYLASSKVLKQKDKDKIKNILENSNRKEVN